ncbi:MAG TPA: alpha/beta fold hydrolase [Solirubrobacteraceae bacterium]|nr:alpha/beta fold hydrolase [Solirubrobacteraceae bacterium]
MDSTFTPSHRGGSGSPLVLIHGFTDSWRGWELVLDKLESRHDVLAVTLPGHAGGPPLDGLPTDALMPDAVEEAMDEAGFERAHLVGNSLGGYVALQLAARGRAQDVVALAPAGGLPPDDARTRETLEYFKSMHGMVKAAAPHADTLFVTAPGKRQATLMTAVRYEHIPAELLAHQLRASAECAALPLLDFALASGWQLDAGAIDCPLRFVWGTEDKLLPWPQAAARYRDELFPTADWVVLDDVGHCPQLDIPLETAELILGFTSG